MRDFYIRRKPNGVPILSRNEIDNIGEKLAGDFCPDALKEPQALDVDVFVKEYAGLDLKDLYLTNNGIYLGLTVFYDNDKVIYYDPEKKQADYISLKAGTVVIDSSLMVEKEKHRRRFTLMHEAAGHWIFHKYYYQSHKELLPCRADAIMKQRNADCSQWTDGDWLEWQADCISSATLMPRRMVEQVVKTSRRLFIDLSPEGKMRAVIEDVAETFDVSPEAAFYRIRSLGLIPKGESYEWKENGIRNTRKTILDFLPDPIFGDDGIWR